MSLIDTIQSYSEQPLNKQLLLNILKEYKRPYDKIGELVKQHILVQIKKGLYIPGKNLKAQGPARFPIANHLYGPSYVSSDSALSYWGFIAERVHEISSITTMLSKQYKTPVGRFSYTHMHLPYYCFGIRQVALTEKQTVLMASPKKAICDKIITTSGVLLRSVKQTLDLLIEDFRIDKQLLKELDSNAITSWLDKAPKESSLKVFVKTLNILSKNQITMTIITN